MKKRRMLESLRSDEAVVARLLKLYGVEVINELLDPDSSLHELITELVTEGGQEAFDHVLKRFGGIERFREFYRGNLALHDSRPFVDADDGYLIQSVPEFRPQEWFDVGEQDGIQIAYLGSMFKRFLDVVEPAEVSARIGFRVLERKQTSQELKQRLGEDIGITLGQMRRCVTRLESLNRHGRFLFFCKVDIGTERERRVVWPIAVTRDLVGWWFDAEPVLVPDIGKAQKWEKGCMVFFRHSTVRLAHKK